jgi:hypothetical protein
MMIAMALLIMDAEESATLTEITTCRAIFLGALYSDLWMTAMTIIQMFILEQQRFAMG